VALHGEKTGCTTGFRERAFPADCDGRLNLASRLLPVMEGEPGMADTIIPSRDKGGVLIQADIEDSALSAIESLLEPQLLQHSHSCLTALPASKRRQKDISAQGHLLLAPTHFHQ
jgi:hypothetical protein